MLDAILKGYVEEAVARRFRLAGLRPAVVNDIVRKVDLNEYNASSRLPVLRSRPRLWRRAGRSDRHEIRQLGILP